MERPFDSFEGASQPGIDVPQRHSPVGCSTFRRSQPPKELAYQFALSAHLGIAFRYRNHRRLHGNAPSAPSQPARHHYTLLGINLAGGGDVRLEALCCQTHESPRAEIASEGKQLDEYPRLLRQKYSARSPGERTHRVRQCDIQVLRLALHHQLATSRNWRTICFSPPLLSVDGRLFSQDGIR